MDDSLTDNDNERVPMNAGDGALWPSVIEAHEVLAGISGRPSRILVVYDDAPMRASIVTALAPRSHLLETRSPTGALDLFLASGNYLDVVIVTCLASRERPHYSSRIGLVAAMFQRWPWIPVIIISRAQESARLIGQTLLTGTRAFSSGP